MATTCKLIAKTTLGSSAANIEFTSIPSTYTDLLLVLSVRSDRATVVDDSTRIRFNGASADTNLSYRLLYGSGAAAASESGTFGFIGTSCAAGATSSTFASIEVYIPNYAGSTNKSYSSTYAQETNGTTAYAGAIAGLFADTTAISSLKVFLGTGPNFVANSSAYLFGISKA